MSPNQMGTGLGTPALAGYGPTTPVYDHVGADNEKPTWDKGDAAFDQVPEVGVGWYQGQTVGNNPWWVRLDDTTKNGLHNINAYMASYYINVPQNKIPGVPICTD